MYGIVKGNFRSVVERLNLTRLWSVGSKLRAWGGLCQCGRWGALLAGFARVEAAG